MKNVFLIILFLLVSKSIKSQTDLMDLELDVNQLITTLRIDHISDLTDYTVNNWWNKPSECMITEPDEHCVNSLYNSTLLRFSTVTLNVGTADYILGQTPWKGISSGYFHWSECHGHHHFDNYAEYKLFDMNCNDVVVGGSIGGKRGFRATDNGPYPDSPYPNCAKYFSGYNSDGSPWGTQGLSVGCYDVYDELNSCNFLDLTGIQDGLYLFRLRLNWDINTIAQYPNLQESNYTNNTGYVLFRLSQMQSTNPAMNILYSGHTLPTDLVLNNIGNLTESKIVTNNIETISNVVVPTNNTVELIAGNEIILRDGFIAQEGSNFRAYTDFNCAVMRLANIAEEENKREKDIKKIMTNSANYNENVLDRISSIPTPHVVS